MRGVYLGSPWCEATTGTECRDSAMAANGHSAGSTDELWPSD